LKFNIVIYSFKK